MHSTFFIGLLLMALSGLMLIAYGLFISRILPKEHVNAFFYICACVFWIGVGLTALYAVVELFIRMKVLGS